MAWHTHLDAHLLPPLPGLFPPPPLHVPTGVGPRAAILLSRDGPGHPHVPARLRSLTNLECRDCPRPGNVWHHSRSGQGFPDRKSQRLLDICPIMAAWTIRGAYCHYGGGGVCRGRDDVLQLVVVGLQRVPVYRISILGPDGVALATKEQRHG